MEPQELLFWMSPLADAPVPDPNLLCRRHADAMIVPRGWTLDDRRDGALRLFRPKEGAGATPTPRARRSRPARRDEGPEQLQIDGTGGIERPSAAGDIGEAGAEPGSVGGPRDDGDRVGGAAPWQPDFDAADDLDGLLEVSSPLLARAFRGTDRPKR